MYMCMYVCMYVCIGACMYVLDIHPSIVIVRYEVLIVVTGNYCHLRCDSALSGR